MTARKAIIGILLAASLSGNVAFLVTAAVRRGSTPVSVLDGLTLTRDQEAQFEPARRSFQTERARARARMAELRGVLADELVRDAPDRAAMLRATDQMGEVHAAMRSNLVEHLLALHALLEPGQRELVAEAMRSGSAGTSCPGAVLDSAGDHGAGPRP